MRKIVKNTIIVMTIMMLISPMFLSTFSMAKEEINEPEMTIEEIESEGEEPEEDTDIEEPEITEEIPEEEEIVFEPEEATEEEPAEEETEEQEIEKEIVTEEIPVTLSNVSNTILEEDFYTIRTALDETKLIEITGGKTSNNANVAIGKDRNIFQQQFKFKYSTTKQTYTITARNSNKALDVAYGEKRNGVNVQQYTSNGSAAQQWILEDAGEGYYYIVSKCNGLYLDIANGSSQNGTNVQMYTGNQTKAQKFKIERVAPLACEKVLEEGTYQITTALSSTKALQVRNGRVDNGSNIELATNRKKAFQKFDLQYNEQLKTYTILATYSHKAFDVAYGENRNGANVQQYDSNTSAAQQWILQDAGEGYYYIVSKCNGLYLDVASGSTQDGTNIQVYEGNRTKAQKFKFERVTTIQPQKTIDDGTYYIQTQKEENKVLKGDAASGKVVIAKTSDVINLGKRFKISYTGNGYYTIQCTQTGKYLTVENGNHNNGTLVRQENKNNTTRQEWIITPAKNGGYSIVSRFSGLYFDIPFGTPNVGTNIQMYEGNESIAQEFQFKEVEEIQISRLLEDGVYRINTALNGNKVLDVAGGSYQNSANIQLWSRDTVQQQKFQITYNEEKEYYQIQPVHSGKVLDVAGGNTSNGANVQQYQSNNTEAQQWILQEAGNGQYYIISKKSFLYMDVASASTDNGTNIQLYEGNGSTAQKFKIERTTMLDEDIYNIAIRNNTNQLLDISEGSRAENANLQIWQNSNVDQQTFKVEYIDNQYCKIMARHSNKVLTVKGKNVVQATDTNSFSQQWFVEIAGNGFYQIRSRETGEYLDVDNNGTVNGTNVKVHIGNGGNAQKFRFIALPRRYGIDVSEFNGVIDWEAVKYSGHGDFAIIRAGYRGYRTGKIVTDVQFVKNVRGAMANNIPIGLYFFTQATSTWEAIEEANYVLNLIRQYNVKVTYPIAIDTESSGAENKDGRADYLDNATRTAVCNAFVETIQNAGYHASIYASRNWFYDRLDVWQLNKGDIWVAQYTSAPQTDYRYRYHMWQHTSKGSVSGIYGNVDLDISYKGY